MTIINVKDILTWGKIGYTEIYIMSNLKTNKRSEIASKIKSYRKSMGLGKVEFANILGMNASGERTIRGWENGEHVPTQKRLDDIERIISELDRQKKLAPFRKDYANDPKFTFIDLFAGIGGTRLPFQKLGGKCVFTSEWDKFAQKTYAVNFGDIPNGDITKIPAKDIPDHDILLGGFPCQAFSQAGLKKGFYDTRGTMFFELQRILSEKKPKVFLLENVKQLKGHDKGRTLETILNVLTGSDKAEIEDNIKISNDTRHALSKQLNYWVDFKILRAADFGVPQNRERIYIVGFCKDYFGEKKDFNNIFNWPTPPKKDTRLGDILENLSALTVEDDCYTISDQLWKGHQNRKKQHKEKGNGFGYTLYDEDSPYTNTLSARYYKDGSEVLIDQAKLNKNPRKLTPRECARLQGFPEDFIVDGVSHSQIYKQFGNSVCINVIQAIADKIIRAIDEMTKEKSHVN